jgi:hexokinase
MIVEAFRDALELGLEKPGQVVVCSVQIFSRNCLLLLVIYQPMIPTFVFGFPTGSESGDFLALDLGSFTILI